MKFEHKTYSDSGIRMNYITAGKGKPLLFLHGVFMDAMAYSKMLKLLAKNHKVIAVDLPCFGKSSTPKEVWDFRDFAVFLNKFIVSLGIKKLVVMGHSFGGGIAFCMAAKNKDIKRLILLDSAGVPVEYSKLKFAYLFFMKQSAKALVKTGRLDLLTSIGGRMGKSLLLHAPKLDVVLNTIRKSLKGDYTGEMRKIKADTLIIWGKRDEVFPKKSAEFLKKHIKNSKLIFVKGGHSWCMFHPEKLVFS